jgi:hypothetical protein
MQRKEPIRQVLTARGLSVPWLAGATGYDIAYCYQVTNGHSPASTRFRRLCAIALKLPEDELFITEAVA